MATQHTATCHTDGCDNSGVPIEVFMNPGDGIACGPCGSEITDMEPPLPVVEEMHDADL